MMNCPHCDAPIAKGATTCQECGRSVSAASPPPTRPDQRTSETAIASLVCGILGWSVLPVVGAILSIILGNTAKSEIQRSDGTIGGDGLAALGIALGYANLAVAALAIVIVVLAAILGIALPIGLGICGLCVAFG